MGLLCRFESGTLKENDLLVLFIHMIYKPSVAFVLVRSLGSSFLFLRKCLTVLPTSVHDPLASVS